MRARCAEPLGAVRRLWDACQTPDFRKTTPDEHIRLARQPLRPAQLRDAAGCRKTGWPSSSARLDRSEGEIDALSTRLAGVRTLAYVANRPNWLAERRSLARDGPAALENRLSDALHERLMARFIDRRTSALVRGLGRSEDLLAGVSSDGVGDGGGAFRRQAQRPRLHAGGGDGRAGDQGAARRRRCGPWVRRWRGGWASSRARPTRTSSCCATGDILWRGEAAGALANDRPFAPRARLHGEFGAAEVRERAVRRLEAFVAGQAAARAGHPEAARGGDRIGRPQGAGPGAGVAAGRRPAACWTAAPSTPTSST